MKSFPVDFHFIRLKQTKMEYFHWKPKAVKIKDSLPALEIKSAQEFKI